MVQRLRVSEAVGQRKGEQAARVLRAACEKPGLGRRGAHRGGWSRAERLQERRGLFRVPRGDGAGACGPRGGRGGLHRRVEGGAVGFVEKVRGALGGVRPRAAGGAEHDTTLVARRSDTGERQRARDSGTGLARVGLLPRGESLAYGALVVRGRRETRGLAEGFAGEHLVRPGCVRKESGDRRLFRGEPGRQADPRREARKAERFSVEAGHERGSRRVAARDCRGGGREPAAQGREVWRSRGRRVRRKTGRGERREKREDGGAQEVPLSPSARATRRARPRGSGRARP